MAADYSISVDPTGFVRYRLAGFFDAAELARFSREREVALHRLECAAGEFVTMVDVSELNIQSQDVAARFEAMLGARDSVRRRLAIVVGDSLVRMQARRLAAPRSNVRLFAARAEADAWLREPGCAALA